MNHTVPDSPSSFAEAMLRSTIEADELASERINDRWLREAHTHTAVNGLVAALAMEVLRDHAPDAAEAVTDQLNHIITAGDLGGPTYRIAKALGYDPDQWLAEFKERAALRKAKTT